MARYVNFDSKHESNEYTTDIKNLTQSVPIITMYFIIMPTFLTIFLKIVGTEHVSKLTFKIVSIYGYSFAIFIPATLLYIIPINGFKWLVLFAAAGISLFFFAKEIFQIVRTNFEKVKLAAGVT